jgi:microcystin-dependent protein
MTTPAGSGVTNKGTTYADGSQVTSTNLNDIVDDAVFNNNAVDDSTIGLNSSTPKALFVKDSGITTAKINDSAVTTAKINDDAVTAAKIAAGAVADIVYPVGSIFTTTNNYADSAAVVAAIGGTTWVRFGEGEVLVGYSTTDGDFSAGATGGAKTHTLASSELPNHTHNLYVTEYQGGDDCAWTAGATNGRVGGNNINRVTRTSSQNGGKGAEIIGGTAQDIDGTSGQAHENMPPYIVVYMWKRTQ